jgi:hypothetical protein
MRRIANTELTRELAQRLLAYEAVTVVTANPGQQALHRVCDKLSRPLTTMAGAAVFRSLLARALALAKKESPLLEDWEVRVDGSLHGLNGEAVESSTVVVAHLIGLMFTFVGESFTLRLLRDVWLDLPDCEVTVEEDESK